MAKRPRGRKKLKPLKAKLDVKSGNIPDNTSLEAYLKREKDVIKETKIPVTLREAEIIGRAWTNGTLDKLSVRDKKVFLNKVFKRIKVSPIQRAKFEARREAVYFLGEGKSDSDVDKLTSMLINAFDKGVKVGRSRKKVLAKKSKKK